MLSIQFLYFYLIQSTFSFIHLLCQSWQIWKANRPVDCCQCIVLRYELTLWTAHSNHSNKCELFMMKNCFPVYFYVQCASAINVILPFYYWNTSFLLTSIFNDAHHSIATLLLLLQYSSIFLLCRWNAAQYRSIWYLILTHAPYAHWHRMPNKASNTKLITQNDEMKIPLSFDWSWLGIIYNNVQCSMFIIN